MFTIKNRAIALFILIFSCPSIGGSEETVIDDPDSIELLSYYLAVYEDKAKTIGDLVLMFTVDMQSRYELELEYKTRRNSRFFSSGLGRYMSFSQILDAPIRVQNNRKIVDVDCKEYNVSSQKCAIISGQTIEDYDWEVVVGFNKKEDIYLINYIQRSAFNGGSVIEWKQR